MSDFEPMDADAGGPKPPSLILVYDSTSCVRPPYVDDLCRWTVEHANDPGNTEEMLGLVRLVTFATPVEAWCTATGLVTNFSCAFIRPPALTGWDHVDVWWCPDTETALMLKDCASEKQDDNDPWQDDAYNSAYETPEDGGDDHA